MAGRIKSINAITTMDIFIRFTRPRLGVLEFRLLILFSLSKIFSPLGFQTFNTLRCILTHMEEKSYINILFMIIFIVRSALELIQNKSSRPVYACLKKQIAVG